LEMLTSTAVLCAACLSTPYPAVLTSACTRGVASPGLDRPDPLDICAPSLGSDQLSFSLLPVSTPPVMCSTVATLVSFASCLVPSPPRALSSPRPSPFHLHVWTLVYRRGTRKYAWAQPASKPRTSRSSRPRRPSRWSPFCEGTSRGRPFYSR
jgi:hypothetical protein